MNFDGKVVKYMDGRAIGLKNEDLAKLSANVSSFEVTEKPSENIESNQETIMQEAPAMPVPSAFEPEQEVVNSISETVAPLVEEAPAATQSQEVNIFDNPAYVPAEPAIAPQMEVKNEIPSVNLPSDEPLIPSMPEEATVVEETPVMPTLETPVVSDVQNEEEIKPLTPQEFNLASEEENREFSTKGDAATEALKSLQNLIEENANLKSEVARLTNELNALKSEDLNRVLTPQNNMNMAA